MSTAPLVTVGLTCHNAEDTVASAVESARRQTLRNIEILAVDDASTDLSVSELRRLQPHEPRLRVIERSENGGVAAARNTLLAHARGEFIAFFDDDDVSAPQRVADQLERICAYEAAIGAELVLCHTAREVVAGDGRRHQIPALGMDATPAPHGTAVFDFILTGRGAWRMSGAAATCSQMARASVYAALGGFDESLQRSEDTELNLRAALAGAHFPGIARPLVTQTLTVSDDKRPEAERDATLAVLARHGRHPRVASWCRFNVGWCEVKYRLATGQRLRAAVRMAGLAVRWPDKFVLRALRSLPALGTRRALGTGGWAADPDATLGT